jgi:hypothetical protein
MGGGRGWVRASPKGGFGRAGGSKHVSMNHKLLLWRENEMPERTHDPQVCSLGWANACEDCRTKLDEAARERNRLANVRNLLMAVCRTSWIEFKTAVEVLWLEIEPTMEHRIEQLAETAAKEAIKKSLERLQIVLNEREDF